MVRQVMDVEATQPEDHIFLATHYPTKMYRQNLTEAKFRIPYDEERFLEDFLETPDFVFVPILGTSGTGKSHLIRWLYTRLKSICKEPHYRVLLIPKVGTNLRDILERILTGIEGSEFDEYRSRLRQATNNLTEAEAREQLLANLAISVGLSGKNNISSLSDVEYEIAKGLPDLLRDPYFTEQFWLKPEGIIERLVTHVLGTQNTIEDIEERRGFSIEDLPQGILNRERASEKARDFYTALHNDFIPKQEVVKWLNRHLDAAIAKVLNLGRDDLQRLMLDVRRVLAKQDVELILLIEDFAKFQGIDHEVLEAILARPKQVAGDPLCAMRTALACTDGYFGGLDTVVTRVDFYVNLNIETVNEQSLVTQTDVQQLASRYLNAVRLSDGEIRTWLRDADEETGQPYHPVPNACLDCEYRPACHAGFGQIDGIGLYPFNAKAIERMRDRVNTGMFNPRTLIKNVLRYTLEYHRSDLEEGRFPSPLLLAHFKGSPLSTIITQNIKSKDTPENASRREALLNLWTDGNELHDLPPEVHTAFDLCPLGIQVQKPVSTTTATQAKTATATSTVITTVTPTTPAVEVTGTTTTSLPSKLVEQLQALDEWRTGTPLPQLVAQALFPLIFDAINTRIDWAASLLLQKQFVPQFFKSKTNIHFRNDFKGRNTSLSDNFKHLPRGVNLILPIEESEIGNTTFALQAILLYHYYKHWRFENGATYFRTYARKLEEWSNFVLSEIPKISAKSSTVLDPVPAVVELLAITGRMAGCTTTSLENLIDSVFADLEKVDISSRTETWQKLFSSLKKNQPKLREVLESRIPCTKGNRSVLQVIDAAQLIGPLKSVASTWQPQANVSNISEDPPFDAISKARKSVDELLEQAVLDERDRHLRIYQRVIEELGEEFSQSEVVESLQKAIEKTTAIGAFTGVNRDDLRQVMEEFEGVRLKDYLGKMQKLQNMNEVAMLLPLLSSLSERPVEVVSKFLNTARRFLEKSRDAVQSYRANLKVEGGNELEECYQTIEQSLLELQQLTNSIKGEL
ncbi:hypothetical protein H6G62_05995 [Phormidium sp. FACHB-1136]|nr:hypothetical protein [Phormidium sp. FACHB-1136]